jgi:hypothetical protein
MYFVDQLRAHKLHKRHICTLLQFFVLLLYCFLPQPTTINQVLLSSVGKIFYLNYFAGFMPRQ